MFQYKNLCGVEKNFLDKKTLFSYVDVMKNFEPTTIPEGNAYGVDYKHPYYEWFIQNLFRKLQCYTSRPDLKLIFAMYADVTESFTIHRDIKPLPESVKGKHFASFLLPVSVDNEVDKCNKNCTLIFENAMLLEPNYQQSWHKIVPNSISSPYYKLIQQITWNCGDLIWWNSIIPHAGASLQKLDLISKQMIVVHTYV